MVVPSVSRVLQWYTGKGGGPGHVVWEAGIVLSQYMVKHAGTTTPNYFVLQTNVSILHQDLINGQGGS